MLVVKPVSTDRPDIHHPEIASLAAVLFNIINKQHLTDFKVVGHNKQHHRKVLLGSFQLSGHLLVFIHGLV